MSSNYETAVFDAPTSNGHQAAYNILETIADAVYTLDAEWRYIYANRAFYRFVGRTVEETIGGSMLELLPEFIETPFYPVFKNALETRQPAEIENYYAPLDKWFVVRVFPAENGGITVVNTDITETKRALEKLRDSEELLQGTINALTGHIAVLDRNGVIVKVNETWRKFAEENLFQGTNYGIGQNYIEACIPKDDTHECDPHGEAAAEGIRKVANGALEVFELEYPCHSPTEQRWFVMRVTRFNESADDLRVVVAHENVTERKLAENALRESEEKLRRTVKFNKFSINLTDALRPLSDPMEIQTTAGRVLGEWFNANRVLYFEVRDGEYFVKRDYTNDVSTLAGKGYAIASFDEQMLATYRSGRVASSPDVAADKHLSADERAAFAAVQIGAYIGAPIVKNGEFVAGLSVQKREPHSWTADDIALVEEAAERTWEAVTRARAEQALADSEEQYRTLFNSIDEGFCTCEVIFDESDNPVDYRILEANPAFERLTGINTAEALSGKTILEIVPNLEQHWIEIYGIVAWSGKAIRFEQGSDALGSWFDVYAFRVGEPEERKVAILFSNITEQKLAAEKLRASEKQLQMVTDAIPALVSYVNADQRYQFVNRSYSEWFGQPAEYFIGKHLKEIVGETAYTQVLPEIERVLAGETFYFERLMPYKTGGARFVGVEYVADKDENGAVKGYYALVQDITKRKQTEEKLRFLAKLNQALLSLTEPDEIMQVTARMLGEHLQVNRCAYAEVEADENHFNLTGDYTHDTFSIVGYMSFQSFGDEVLRLMRAGEPYVVNDIETDPRAADFLDAYHQTDIAAVICLPLHKNGKFTAAMAVHQKTPRVWRQEEIELVQLVVNRCWESLERARTDKQLRRAEERFRLLTENAEEYAMIFLDAEAHITAWNVGAERILGYSEAEVLGQPGHIIFTPEDRANKIPEKELSTATAEGNAKDERWHIRKDGSRFFAFGEMIALRDDAENLRGFAKLFRDLTERKKLDDSLRESEALFRELAELLPASVFILKGDSHIYANAEAERMTGYTRQELLTVAPYQLTNETGRNIIKDIRAARERGTDMSAFHEMPLVTKSGEQRWVLSCSIRTVQHGEPVTLLASFDITERKSAEKALLAAQNFTQAVVESVPTLIYIYDLDEQRNIYLSPQITEMFGFSSNDLQETGADLFAELFHPDDLEQVLAHHSHIQASAQNGVFTIQYRMKHRNGDWRWINSRDVVFSRDANGKPTQILGTAEDITDQRRAQEALRESEERYRTLFNSIDEGFYISQLFFDDAGNAVDYRFLEVNPIFEELTGIKNAQDKLVSELVPNLEPSWYEIYGRVASTGESVRFINKSDVLDGRWFDVYAFRVGAPEERKIAVIFKNITEQKRAEEAFRESQTQLALALQAGKAGTYEWNIKDNINTWSPEIEDLYGVPVGTFEGNYDAWAKRVVPEDAVRVAAGIETVIAARQNKFIYEFRAVLPDGSHRWIEGRSRFEYDPDGKPLRMFGINVDISESKQTQESLKELNQQIERQAKVFDVTLSTITDYVYTFDRDGRFLYANKILLDLWGLTLDEAVGKTMADLNYPKEVETAIFGAVKQVFETKETIKNETFYTSPSGESGYFENILSPVFDADGQVEVVIGSSRSITERKRAEEALREADRRKDEFLATLAHELRNPLAPIQTALEIMRHGASAEKTAEAREIAARQIEQLRHLIDDLLDISRITQGKIKLKKEIIDLRTAIESAIETSRPQIDGFNHQLYTSLPSKPIYVEGDPVRLSQVFLNLLNNAAKFTESDGRIEISARVEADEAVVKVKDTGAGIPPEMLESIFEMFSQVERTGSRPQGGLGIGLNLVRRLVEKHGGAVTARSEGQNTGSEFTVRLPLASAEQQTLNEKVAVQTAQPNVSELHKLRLLVVDDNLDAADMMKFVLELEKHTVAVAYSGTDALAVAGEFQPDACVLDIGLPDIDGYALAQRMRETMPDVYLIALSGWGQDEDRRRSAEAGFNHHLVKPVKIDELLSLLPHSHR